MRFGILLILALNIITVIGHADETAAVNRFYGVVLKEPELLANLNAHQVSRKKAYVELAAKYKSFIKEEYEASADSGDLEMAKVCGGELDRVGDFISSIESDSTDCVSASLLTPDIAGLNTRPPSKLVGFRQTWQKDRRLLLVANQKKLNEDLGKFVGQLTKMRKLNDAESVLNFQQLVAERLKKSEAVLVAIAARENPESEINRESEDKHVVVYPADMCAYSYGVLIDPADRYWLDGNGTGETLYLQFSASQFGTFRNRVSKVLLNLEVPTFGGAESSHYIRVYEEGKQVGIKKGGRQGEKVQIPLELNGLKTEEEEIVLRLTINGSDGMGVVGAGVNRPRLLLGFE